MVNRPYKAASGAVHLIGNFAPVDDKQGMSMRCIMLYRKLVGHCAILFTPSDEHYKQTKQDNI